MWGTEKDSGRPEGRAEVWGGTGKKALSGLTKNAELHPEDVGDVQSMQTGSHLHFVKLEAKGPSWEDVSRKEHGPETRLWLW